MDDDFACVSAIYYAKVANGRILERTTCCLATFTLVGLLNKNEADIRAFRQLMGEDFVQLSRPLAMFYVLVKLACNYAYNAVKKKNIVGII